jgi:hypothetical protein
MLDLGDAALQGIKLPGRSAAGCGAYGIPSKGASTRIALTRDPYNRRPPARSLPSHKWAACTIATKDALRDLLWRTNMPARFGVNRGSVELLPRSNKTVPQGRYNGYPRRKRNRCTPQLPNTRRSRFFTCEPSSPLPIGVLSNDRIENPHQQAEDMTAPTIIAALQKKPLISGRRPDMTIPIYGLPAPEDPPFGSSAAIIAA